MISHLGKMPSNVIGGADSQRRNGLNAIGIAFFGDGASSTGEIHESMNLASVLDIPVLFIVENNKYAYSTPLDEQYTGKIVDRARGLGMKGIEVDVADLEANLEIFQNAIDETRATSRPMLIECHSLRLRGHAGYDTCDYIDPEVSKKWEAQDCLPNFRKRLVAKGYTEVLDSEDQLLKQFVDETVTRALKIEKPDPNSFQDDVFAKSARRHDWTSENDTSNLTFAQALNQAHRKILSESPESLVMGQDIADYGGPFKVTKDLFNEFGRSRVTNTPICESAMVGYATGLAVVGHRPIVEFQFADFATDATTQICLNAGTYHFRSGAKAPIVLRFPCGGGLTFGSFHSQDLETLYLHIPGLKLLYPSTPQDAYNALLAAYEDDNPVCLFEHKRLYTSLKAPVAHDPNYLDVWKPALRRQGNYATVVTYGDMTIHANEALEYLALEYDISCDLFDLRALNPLRLESIRESVARTGRLVVVHESRRNLGFGAELIARITEKQFFDLEAPPLRIAAIDTPVPFAEELEAAYRPSKDSILTQMIDWIEA